MTLVEKQAKPVALVTGGARRVGASIVEALHAYGFRVIVHCRHSLCEATALVERLNQLKKASAVVLQANLSQRDEVSQLIEAAVAGYGRLDVLVNNASVFLASDSAEDDPNAWDTLFRTNVQAPYWLSTIAYPYLAKHEGSIVNITDIHAEKPLRGYSLYCQTKAALMMQTKSLALEFAPKVRVNAVAPGAVCWPEGESHLNALDKEKIIAKTPLKRHGTPENIAAAVIAMTTNRFITGETLRVDGGRMIKQS